MNERELGKSPKRPRLFFYRLALPVLLLLLTGGLLLLFLSSLFIPAIIMIGVSVALMVGLGVHYALYKSPIVMTANLSNPASVVEVANKGLEPTEVQLEATINTSNLTADQNTSSFNSPLSNKPEKQTIACPSMIRPQIEAALKGYSGSGPLKIYLFTYKEIKLIQTLTLPYNGSKMTLKNTDETIKNVENYVGGGFSENSQGIYIGEYNKRYLLLLDWLRKIMPDSKLTCFSSPSEDTPVQLDEKDALKLRGKYTLPDTEVDLIAEALKNPEYVGNHLIIPFLPNPELSLYKGLDHKCGISKRHPAMLEIVDPARWAMLHKIKGVMEDATLFDMFNGTFGLDKDQVEEFTERYSASTQVANSRFSK